MKVDYYLRRRHARRQLFAFTQVWRPRLKKMRLVLSAQASDVLEEAGHVAFTYGASASAELTIAVNHEGRFSGTLTMLDPVWREKVTHELEADKLDALLRKGQRCWSTTAKGRVVPRRAA